ncbi:hypothetical protein OCU04_000797 [Sclerotinia nivalis]|uniref:Uncharacterized protein n=1 Tax=Sclerotinia nivalis TaxID=352851 RepID=A0A9X0AZZ8_9HELO|nr:hypothetical protein OCU04_000797 [Sclerotinia nivalis]
MCRGSNQAVLSNLLRRLKDQQRPIVLAFETHLPEIFSLLSIEQVRNLPLGNQDTLDQPRCNFDIRCKSQRVDIPSSFNISQFFCRSTPNILIECTNDSLDHKRIYDEP